MFLHPIAVLSMENGVLLTLGLHCNGVRFVAYYDAPMFPQDRAVQKLMDELDTWLPMAGMRKVNW